jgi:hypothetical protein
MSKETKSIAVDMAEVIKAVKGLTSVDFQPSKGGIPIPPVSKEQVEEFFWANPLSGTAKGSACSRHLD